MSAVSEIIVREYLDTLGFLLHQPRKFQVIARPKQPEEEVELVAVNPRAAGEPPAPGVWTGRELARVPRAVVSVRGWFSETFSPATLLNNKELFRLAEEGVLRRYRSLLGAGPVARIVCLPELPVAGMQRHRILELLREGGIDGVLLFRGMLTELVAGLDANKSYDKSDLLQTLRILKAYGLIRDAQMELFGRRKAKPEVRRPRAADEAAGAAATHGDDTVPA